MMMMMISTLKAHPSSRHDTVLLARSINVCS